MGGRPGASTCLPKGKQNFWEVVTWLEVTAWDHSLAASLLYMPFWSQLSWTPCIAFLWPRNPQDFLKIHACIPHLWSWPSTLRWVHILI